MAGIGNYGSKDRRTVPFKKINIHPSLWQDLDAPLNHKEFPIQDLSRKEKRATMDEKLMSFYENGKIKTWQGEKIDGSIWPNSMWGVLKNGILCRGKVSNAWADCDTSSENDKIDAGKSVELTLIDNGMAKEVFRKKTLFKLPESFDDKNYPSFSKILSLQIKEPKNLGTEEINALFTQVVQSCAGLVFAKPVSKQPISGGGERSIVELYLPPTDYAKKNREKEVFNSLSGLVKINEIVCHRKRYAKWLGEFNKLKDLETEGEKPQEEWVME